ncbi:hypothetical protein [Lysobacter gummosus]|uniref:hypothetical protein n=1 Tax=Lysobacter gummosus TaxID=262324 RepID=UPI00363DF3E9
MARLDPGPTIGVWRHPRPAARESSRPALESVRRVTYVVRRGLVRRPARKSLTPRPPRERYSAYPGWTAL